MMFFYHKIFTGFEHSKLKELLKKKGEKGTFSSQKKSVPVNEYHVHVFRKKKETQTRIQNVNTNILYVNTNANENAKVNMEL